MECHGSIPFHSIPAFGRGNWVERNDSISAFGLWDRTGWVWFISNLCMERVKMLHVYITFSVTIIALYVSLISAKNWSKRQALEGQMYLKFIPVQLAKRKQRILSQ